VRWLWDAWNIFGVNELHNEAEPVRCLFHDAKVLSKRFPLGLPFLVSWCLRKLAYLDRYMKVGIVLNQEFLHLVYCNFAKLMETYSSIFGVVIKTSHKNKSTNGRPSKT